MLDADPLRLRTFTWVLNYLFYICIVFSLNANNIKQKSKSRRYKTVSVMTNIYPYDF